MTGQVIKLSPEIPIRRCQVPTMLGQHIKKSITSLFARVRQTIAADADTIEKAPVIYETRCALTLGVGWNSLISSAGTNFGENTRPHF